MNIIKILKSFFDKKEDDSASLPHNFNGVLLMEEDNRIINVGSFRPDILPLISQYPESKISDISRLEVQNQLLNGSCTGQELGTQIKFQLLQATGSVYNISHRFPYAGAKKIDGNPDTEGSYPDIVAKFGHVNGFCVSDVVPDDNSLSHKKYINVPLSEAILADAARIKPFFQEYGFAQIDPDKDAMIREITENGVFGLTIGVDPNCWFSGFISKPARVTSYHRILIYGYRIVGDDVVFLFRNSWGTGWGFGGNGEFKWSDYQNHIHNLLSFTKIPSHVMEQAKSLKYMFKGKPISLGERGPRVLQLQLFLQREGFFNKGWEMLTGFYGSYTATCVYNWQLDKKVDSVAQLKKIAGRSFGPKSMDIANGGETKKIKTLEEALIQVESGGNNWAIGDRNLTNKAYGPLQIRKPYIDDVNRKMGTTYRAEDMNGNLKLSLWAFEVYMGIYATEAKLGRPVTDQDRARIHNGGPNGYKMAATLPYWEKVKRVLYS